MLLIEILQYQYHFSSPLVKIGSHKIQDLYLKILFHLNSKDEAYVLVKSVYFLLF